MEILICAAVSAAVFIIGTFFNRWANTEYVEERVFTFKYNNHYRTYKDDLGKIISVPKFDGEEVYIKEIRKYRYGKLLSTKHKLVQYTPRYDHHEHW